ncbi:hypothetical protein JCM15519_03180 [Fundidesulfovibrio butyratiphilus]
METRRILSEREDIRYQTKKHWAVFLKAGIYFFLAIFLMWSKAPWQARAVTLIPQEYLKGLSAEDLRSYSADTQRAIRSVTPERKTPAAPDDPRKGGQAIEPRTVGNILVHVAVGVVWTVCFVLTLVFGFLALSRLLSFFSNKVVITPRRVIQQDVLSGSLSSLSLSAVESVRANTGLLGSVLGYGTVVLIMASGQKVVIANLRRPHEFERELFAAK